MDVVLGKLLVGLVLGFVWEDDGGLVHIFEDLAVLSGLCDHSLLLLLIVGT